MSKTNNAALTAEQEKQIRVGVTYSTPDSLNGTSRIDFTTDLSHFRSFVNHIKSIQAPQFLIEYNFYKLFLESLEDGEQDGNLLFDSCLEYLATKSEILSLFNSPITTEIGIQIDDEDKSFLITSYEKWIELVKVQKEISY